MKNDSITGWFFLVCLLLALLMVKVWGDGYCGFPTSFCFDWLELGTYGICENNCKHMKKKPLDH